MTEQKLKEISRFDLETAMKRLDAINESLARENVSLEDSLAFYEEGVALVRHCNAKLDDVERKINVLRTTSDGEVSEQPFDTKTV